MIKFISIGLTAIQALLCLGVSITLVDYRLNQSGLFSMGYGVILINSIFFGSFIYFLWAFTKPGKFLKKIFFSSSLVLGLAFLITLNI